MQKETVIIGLPCCQLSRFVAMVSVTQQKMIVCRYPYLYKSLENTARQEILVSPLYSGEPP